MKRATLTTYSTAPAVQSADLTDHLLAANRGPADRGGPAAPGGSVGPGGQPAPRQKRRRNQQGGQRPETQAGPAHPPSSLETALVATSRAIEAMQLAARDTPARYDVALRYRLDALAHHLQQVKEFIAGMAAR